MGEECTTRASPDTHISSDVYCRSKVEDGDMEDFMTEQNLQSRKDRRQLRNYARFSYVDRRRTKEKHEPVIREPCRTEQIVARRSMTLLSAPRSPSEGLSSTAEVWERYSLTSNSLTGPNCSEPFTWCTSAVKTLRNSFPVPSTLPSETCQRMAADRIDVVAVCRDCATDCILCKLQNTSLDWKDAPCMRRP